MNNKLYIQCLCGCGQPVRQVTYPSLYASVKCKRKVQNQRKAFSLNCIECGGKIPEPKPGKKFCYYQCFVKNEKKRNRTKHECRNITKEAIRTGKLIRQPCEKCGAVHDIKNKLYIHAHHKNYSRPFDITWLCAAHHFAEHERLKR